MIFIDLGVLLTIALLLCILGSAAAIAALLINHPATLLIYLFIGQPMLILAMILYLVTVWQDLLKHQVFKGGRKGS